MPLAVIWNPFGDGSIWDDQILYDEIFVSSSTIIRRHRRFVRYIISEYMIRLRLSRFPSRGVPGSSSNGSVRGAIGAGTESSKSTRTESTKSINTFFRYTQSYRSILLAMEMIH